MAEEGERPQRELPQRELPLGSRTRGPGQPVTPVPGAAAVPTPPVAPAPMLVRQVALAAERQAVAVRRLRWRETVERRYTDSAPAADAASDAAPSADPRATHVATSAVLRTLLARTVRRIRLSLGLDQT